jgi:hypothetical protein
MDYARHPAQTKLVEPQPKMKFHPMTDIFPLIEGREFKDLLESIREMGLLVDIWTYKGEIIDGRNRYNACLEAGVEPRFREYTGTEDSLLDFLLSVNLWRTHITSSQRAVAAFKSLPFFEEEDRKKIQQNQKKQTLL